MATVVRNMVSLIGITPPEKFPLYNPIYKEFTVSENLCLPCNKPDIERLLSVTFQAEVISTRIVNTPMPQGPITASAEGENLTGKKMIIELKIRQKIQYVADEPTQSVHAHHNELIISEYIIINPQYTVNGQLMNAEDILRNNLFVVTPYIEDANAKVMDERCICKNITLFVNVDVKKAQSAGIPSFPIN